MANRTIYAVHQFSTSCTLGDGVTNSMFFTRELLRGLGFLSEIYCQQIPKQLRAEVRDLLSYRGDPATLLLFHHSLGYDEDEWLARDPSLKVLVYHNITPPEYLSDPNLKRLSMLGRVQLARWRPMFAGAYGDSKLNTAELLEHGYAGARTLPLLVDLDRIRSADWDRAVPRRYADSVNILFVGRICENKGQAKLVEAIAEMRHMCDLPVRLLLAGAITNPDYLDAIRKRIEKLGLTRQVDYLGKVNETTLRGLYRAADMLACLSEHEGFGMPLLEAMAYDVPVAALNAASSPDTMGEGGILLDTDDPASCGAVFVTLATEPGLRRRVVEGQRRNLARFERPVLVAGLIDFLHSLDIHVPVRPPAAAAALPPRWRIEGPMDSSYSLAIVNRELARAMHRTGQAVSLLSMDGEGELAPAKDFLASNPDVAALIEAPGAPAADTVLRFCYPPRTEAMAGRVRAIHTFGWEETGFPTRYVSWFNRRLDLVTTLSREVAKTLRDAGVRVPIAVVGAGVDHLHELRPEPPQIDLGEGFRFLHVSSCFPRKGIDVLLTAWGRAFRAGDPVSLVIKTFPNPHNDAAGRIADTRRRDPEYPRVVLIDDDQSDAAIAGLYQACHAFVAPSRGEGFGMPLAEAMWFGLPVITTAWGGQTDFCTRETAWLCDYRFAPSQSHLGIEHSAWAEPDVADLVRQLRAVYEAAPDVRRARTEAARALVAAEYTWPHVAARTRAAVEAVQRLPMLRREPMIGWVSTWNTRCGIATYSGHLTPMLRTDGLTILANRTADLLAADDARVQRCWHADMHAPVNDLIAAIDASGAGTLVVQYNFGFFSLDSLARLVNHMADTGRRIVIFFHATADVHKKNEARISLESVASALSRAQRLFVHSVDDLNRMKDFGLVRNVALFPHGVASQPTLDIAALRRERGLEGRRVLAAYGFLLAHKGMQPLIRAFAQLAASRPDLRLVLATALYPNAESELEDAACEDLIRQLGISERVIRLTGFLSDDESLSWLALADLIVFPYQHTQESASGAVRMGLAAGRPVAVTPLPIFDDLGDAVHRLPGTGPEQLAEGIGRLLDDSELRASTLERAARWCAARRWSTLSARLRDCIDGLANPLPGTDSA